MKEKENKIINGYKMIYKPEHPEAVKTGGMVGYVYEHRVIAEKIMDRSLRNDEEVHHLDNVRSNNSPKNLLILESKQHRKLHVYLNNFILVPKPGVILEKIGVIKYCEICGIEVPNTNKKYCSNECSRIASRLIPEITPEELKIKVWSKPTTEVAKELGVSDVTVSNLCKKLNIEKPERGYWTKIKRQLNGC